MAKKATPKPEVKQPVKKAKVTDNTQRNDLYLKIFVALCSNSQSSNDVEILVNQAQCLTVEALKGMNKEQF